MYDDMVYPANFTEQAVLGLKRHGFLWGALLKLACQPGLLPHPENDFYLKTASEKRKSLLRRLNQLKGEAQELVKLLICFDGRQQRRPSEVAASGHRQPSGLLALITKDRMGRCRDGL